MKKITFVLLSSILLLTACGPKINKEQQERLEVITESVDSITTAVNELDSASIDQMIKEFAKKKEYIQNGLKDTVPYSLIYRLDDFIQLKKGMLFIQNEFNMIKKEANLMNSQIKDLNHDVDNRLVEEDQFERYYELEKKNSEQLETAASQLLLRVKKMQEEYPKLVPVVDSLIDANNAKLNE